MQYRTDTYVHGRRDKSDQTQDLPQADHHHSPRPHPAAAVLLPPVHSATAIATTNHHRFTVRTSRRIATPGRGCTIPRPIAAAAALAGPFAPTRPGGSLSAPPLPSPSVPPPFSPAAPPSTPSPLPPLLSCCPRPCPYPCSCPYPYPCPFLSSPVWSGSCCQQGRFPSPGSRAGHASARPTAAVAPAPAAAAAAAPLRGVWRGSPERLV